MGGAPKGVCNDFAKGYCERVKCKFAHQLPGTQITMQLDSEVNITKGSNVSYGILMNKKTQILLATQDE